MPSSKSILAEIFVFDLPSYFDVIIRQRLKKKFNPVDLFFQSRERSKNMWFWAITHTAHAQRSYLTVAQLSVLSWRCQL